MWRSTVDTASYDPEKWVKHTYSFSFVRTLTSRPFPDDRADSWDYVFWTQTQAYYDCSTKLIFFSVLGGNYNLEWSFSYAVTCEPFPCGHCPWTWPPGSTRKAEVERAAVDMPATDHIQRACIFIYTDKCSSGASTDFITFDVNKEKTNPQCRWEFRWRRGETDQLKKSPGGLGRGACKYLHLRKEIRLNTANLERLVLSVAVCVKDPLHIHPCAWLLGRTGKPHF